MSGVIGITEAVDLVLRSVEHAGFDLNICNRIEQLCKGSRRNASELYTKLLAQLNSTRSRGLSVLPVNRNYASTLDDEQLDTLLRFLFELLKRINPLELGVWHRFFTRFLCHSNVNISKSVYTYCKELLFMNEDFIVLTLERYLEISQRNKDGKGTVSADAERTVSSLLRLIRKYCQRNPKQTWELFENYVSDIGSSSKIMGLFLFCIQNEVHLAHEILAPPKKLWSKFVDLAFLDTKTSFQEYVCSQALYCLAAALRGLDSLEFHSTADVLKYSSSPRQELMNSNELSRLFLVLKTVLLHNADQDTYYTQYTGALQKILNPKSSAMPEFQGTRKRSNSFPLVEVPTIIAPVLTLQGAPMFSLDSETRDPKEENKKIDSDSKLNSLSEDNDFNNREVELTPLGRAIAVLFYQIYAIFPSELVSFLSKECINSKVLSYAIRPFLKDLPFHPAMILSQNMSPDLGINFDYNLTMRFAGLNAKSDELANLFEKEIRIPNKKSETEAEAGLLEGKTTTAENMRIGIHLDRFVDHWLSCSADRVIEMNEALLKRFNGSHLNAWQSAILRLDFVSKFQDINTCAQLLHNELLYERFLRRQQYRRVCSLLQYHQNSLGGIEWMISKFEDEIVRLNGQNQKLRMEQNISSEESKKTTLEVLQQYKEVTSENAKLKEKVSYLERENLEKASHIELLAKQNADLRYACEELKNENQVLRKQRDAVLSKELLHESRLAYDYKLENEQLHKSQMSLNQVLLKRSEENQSLIQKLHSSEKTIQELSSRLDFSSREVTLLRTELDKERSRTNLLNSMCESNALALTEEIRASEQKFEALKEDNLNLVKRVKLLEAELELINRQNDSTRSKFLVRCQSPSMDEFNSRRDSGNSSSSPERPTDADNSIGFASELPDANS